MTVLVLGHTGMLGHVLARYLRERGYRVRTTDARYHGGPDDPLIAEVRHGGDDWVVNATGAFGGGAGVDQLTLINTMLPIHLVSALTPAQRLVHASTDAVFSGRTGWYAADAPRDAQDAYGFSKMLGEVAAAPGRAYAVRTSIIGPAGASGGGLLQWVLQQRGSCRGFTNQFWNGITTLEWAKVCGEVMTGKHGTGGVVQVGTAERSSKLEVVRAIAEAFQHDLQVLPAEAPVAVDRTLRPDSVRPPLRDQLLELRSWYR